MRAVFFFHAAVFFSNHYTMSTFPRCFSRCCAMSTFFIAQHYIYLFHAAAVCLLEQLYYVYFFHIAMLCLLFPRCCAMSTFTRCCAMSTFSTLLCDVYFFLRQCAMSTFPRYCAMSTLSTLLSYVYSFHIAVLYLCLICPR